MSMYSIFFKANDRSVGRPNGSHLLYKGNRTNTITKQNIQIIFASFFLLVYVAYLTRIL